MMNFAITGNICIRNRWKSVAPYSSFIGREEIRNYMHTMQLRDRWTEDGLKIPQLFSLTFLTTLMALSYPTWTFNLVTCMQICLQESKYLVAIALTNNTN